MTAVHPCDRFEREGALAVERGEHLGLHYSVCPDCKTAYARYQRIIAALSFIDEPDEAGALAEDRLIARIHERSSRRWPKVVPLSAFFSFLTLGKRAAAGPSRTALCALTALTTLLTPLPMFMGEGAGAASSQPAIAATAATTEISRAADLHAMIGRPEGTFRRESLGHGANHSRAAAIEVRTIELRRRDDSTRRVRPGSTAASVASKLPALREKPPTKAKPKRRCTRKKCPNVVLEMVVNGLTGYGPKPSGRRAEVRL